MQHLIGISLSSNKNLFNISALQGLPLQYIDLRRCQNIDKDELCRILEGPIDQARRMTDALQEFDVYGISFTSDQIQQLAQALYQAQNLLHTSFSVDSLDKMVVLEKQHIVMSDLLKNVTKRNKCLYNLITRTIF